MTKSHPVSRNDLPHTKLWSALGIRRGCLVRNMSEETFPKALLLAEGRLRRSTQSNFSSTCQNTGTQKIASSPQPPSATLHHLLARDSRNSRMAEGMDCFSNEPSWLYNVPDLLWWSGWPSPPWSTAEGLSTTPSWTPWHSSEKEGADPHTVQRSHCWSICHIQMYKAALSQAICG